MNGKKSGWEEIKEGKPEVVSEMYSEVSLQRSRN
jgi:hypothetical protein